MIPVSTCLWIEPVQSDLIESRSPSVRTRFRSLRLPNTYFSASPFRFSHYRVKTRLIVFYDIAFSHTLTDCRRVFTFSPRRASRRRPFTTHFGVPAGARGHVYRGIHCDGAKRDGSTARGRRSTAAAALFTGRTAARPGRRSKTTWVFPVRGRRVLGKIVVSVPHAAITRVWPPTRRLAFSTVFPSRSRERRPLTPSTHYRVRLVFMTCPEEHYFWRYSTISVSVCGYTIPTHWLHAKLKRCFKHTVSNRV